MKKGELITLKTVIGLVLGLMVVGIIAFASGSILSLFPGVDDQDEFEAFVEELQLLKDNTEKEITFFITNKNFLISFNKGEKKTDDIKRPEDPFRCGSADASTCVCKCPKDYTDKNTICGNHLSRCYQLNGINSITGITSKEDGESKVNHRSVYIEGRNSLILFIQRRGNDIIVSTPKKPYDSITPDDSTPPTLKKPSDQVTSDQVAALEAEIRKLPGSTEFPFSVYRDLMDSEGVEFFAYDDSERVRTVGVGFNMEVQKRNINKVINDNDFNEVYNQKRLLTPTETANMFHIIINDFVKQIHRYADIDYTKQPSSVQEAIINIVYNRGIGAFNSDMDPNFVNFRKAIKEHDYTKAITYFKKTAYYDRTTRNRRNSIISDLTRAS